MSWIEFVSEMTKALAWPLATVLLVISFRQPLLNLIPKLGKLKYKDLELDFTKRLEDAAEEVPAALPAPRAEVESPLVSLAQQSPRAAILEAWLRVERALIEQARMRGLEIPKPESRAVSMLIRSRALDGWQMSVLKDLRGLRNSAAHITEFEPSPVAAVNYIRLALELEESLRPGAA